MTVADAETAGGFVGRQFALEPRCGQQRQLFVEINRNRWVWNRAVSLTRRLRRIAATKKAAGQPVPPWCSTSLGALGRRLTVWRRRRAWLAAGSVVPQQQTLITCVQANANCRAGRAMRPTHKKRRDPIGLRYPAQNATLNASVLQLPKLAAAVRVRRSCADLGEMRHVTVSHDGDRWFAGVCYRVAPTPIPAHPRADDLLAGDDSAAVGLDFGSKITWMLTEGVGGHRPVRMPRATKAQERKIRRIQRQRARCVKGSRAWKRRVKAQRRLQRRVANQRREQIRSMVQTLVRDHAVVCFEGLNLKGMSARPQDRSGARNGRAAKAALNRRLQEGCYRQTLDAARWAARKTGAMVATTPAPYTSQECRVCGHIASENRESQAVFKCTGCDHEANADANASHVIRARSLIALGMRPAGYRPSPERWMEDVNKHGVADGYAETENAGGGSAWRDSPVNSEPTRQSARESVTC